MNDREPETEQQNIGEHDEAPKYRIASAAAALAIFNKLKKDDDKDAFRRSIIQGMIDGNPPYKQHELDESGLGHITNVNFLTMRANLDARAAAAHELVFEVDRIAECKPLRPVSQVNPDLAHDAMVVSEEFSQMVTDWDGFQSAVDMAIRESDATGLGFMLFPDEWDWKPRAFKRGTLLFDPKAKVDIDANDLYMIRDEMSVSDIFGLLDNEAAARKRGWNPEALRKAAVAVFKGGEGQNSEDKYQRSSWESIQQMARNNDAMYQEKQFEKLRIVHILSKEASAPRKVSHLIRTEVASCDEFLMEARHKYDKVSNVLWWLPYNYGDGYARSVRGVASFMMPHEDLSNRFLCRTFDAGFLTASLILQPQTQMDLSKLQIATVGMYTFLPPELKANVQTTFQPQIAPLLSLRHASEQIQKNNTGTYRQHNEGMEREAAKTARQVVEETSKEARYEKAAVSHRYTMLDRLYREMFRRVAVLAGSSQNYPGREEVKGMVERCSERNVPVDFITGHENLYRVSATRALGMGSLGYRMDITNQLMQAPLDEHGKREALRDWVAARVGYRNADKYAVRWSRDQVPSSETSVSLLEWNDITEGHQTLVGTDQLHKTHIDVFLPRMQELIQAADVGQIQDPMAAHRTLALAIEHINGHLQYLGQDARYEGFVKQVMQFLKVAEQAARRLEALAKRMMAQMQQQQAQQQQTVQDAESVLRDRELEAKIYEINQKYSLEKLKQDSLNAARSEKTGIQMNIARGKAAANVQLQAERQAAELEIAARRAEADIALKQQSGR